MQVEKKILKEHFDKILSGEKKFEVRLADWECNVGDTLVLKEWNKDSQSYTGRSLTKEISNIAKTKELGFFTREDIDKYGYQILSLRDNKSRTGIDCIGVSVSFLCHDGQGNILFQKRSQSCRDEKGTWDIGGGKMEFGEDFKVAALRELREEYGCDGEIEYQFEPKNFIRINNGVKTHWVIVGFIIKVDSQEVKNNEPGDIDEIGWYKLDNLPKPLHSALPNEIESKKYLIRKYVK